MKYIILSLILLIILLIVNIRRTKNMFVNIFLIINILLLILSILNNIIGINYEVYSKIKGILELGYALVFTYYTYTITVEKYFTKKEVISALSVVFILCSILMIIYPFSKQVSDFYTSNGLGYTVCYISILVQIFFSFILSLIYITKNKLIVNLPIISIILLTIINIILKDYNIVTYIFTLVTIIFNISIIESVKSK